MPDEQESRSTKGSAPAEDPRLAELTDQALHLLDELADARIKTASLAEWQARCRQLEERLAETRRHVRASRTARLVAPGKPAAESDDIDICLWAEPDLPLPERDRWLLRIKGLLTSRPVSLLCRNDQRPPPNVLSALPSLRLVDIEGPNPAQIWNLGVAGGESPLVLFLQAGAVLGKGWSTTQLAAALDDTVALAQPVLTMQGRSPSLGLEDTGDLRFLPVAFDGEADRTETVPELELAAPEAFVLQRKCSLEVGPFDEDLRTSCAIIDYAMRCKALGKLVIGLPGVRVDLPRRPAAGLEDAADRLVLLARHRPGGVLGELASDPSVWERDEAELSAFARAVLVRLPDLPHAGIPLLLEELAGLRKRVLSPAELSTSLAPIEEALALAESADSSRSAPRQRLARVLEGVRAALQSSARLAEELAAEGTRRREAESREQAARGEAAASQSLAAEAKNRARAAAEDAAAARAESLAQRSEAATSRADAERHRADAIGARAEATSAAAAAARSRAEAEAFERELAAARHSLSALIERAEAAAAEAELRLAELTRRCELAERRAAGLERDLGGERDLLARRVAELARQIGNPQDLHWPSLIEAIARTQQVLRERESWIVVLLEELAGRRIKLRARKLSPDEERFLAERASASPRGLDAPR